MRLLLSLPALALVATGTPSAGTVRYVDASATPPGLGTAEAPFASIQAALASPTTVDGDTVLVAPGVYEELVDFLGKELVLRSAEGAAVTTIDATLQFSLEQSAVQIRSGEGPGCVLEGFTLMGGAGTRVSEPVSGSPAFVGGGLLLLGTAPTIRDCVLVENEADLGGAVYGDSTQALFERCVVASNAALVVGGGLHFRASDVRLVEVEVRDSRENGVSLFGGRLVAERCTLDGSSSFSGNDGGNLRAELGAEVVLVDSVVRNGFTLDGDGGGLWLRDGSLELVRCTLEDNASGDSASDRQGGALHAERSRVTVVDSAFLRNRSGRGGAVDLEDGTASIRGTRFEGNSVRSGLNFVQSLGGALAANRSSVSVSACRFLGNEARFAGSTSPNTTVRGGALWCDEGEVEVEDCLFRGNRALYSGGFATSAFVPRARGGALHGPALVVRSRFERNVALVPEAAFNLPAAGGAVYGAAGLLRCAFVANEVRSPVPGRGPAAEASTLACPTVAGNLPASLPPFGPLCVLLDCTDASGTESPPGLPPCPPERRER